MQTNFFQQLYSLCPDGEWSITIKTGAQNRMIVTTRVTSEKVTDAAIKQIPPLISKGTIEEFDNKYFDDIKNPIRKTVELFLNLEEFEKALDKAKVDSKLEQHKQEKDKKQKDEKQKKYDTSLNKVKELEEGGKFREALVQLPKSEDYPEQAEFLNEKKKELTAKFDQPELF